jgi:hypothetical protein
MTGDIRAAVVTAGVLFWISVVECEKQLLLFLGMSLER